MRSSSAPAAGDGTSPPGQCAGTLALDCLLPGPPSVTVSSHGHRRLAPPQDRRPRTPPRLLAPLSAVLMQRRSLPRARLSKVPVGCCGRWSCTRSYSPSRPRRLRC